mmetsp:Transcript_12870/g.18663  ORF Transcript_12870/g.18663 Transcript_12870/m.18663 type:complete len:220 (-) Transcript_12870:13-672(-)
MEASQRPSTSLVQVVALCSVPPAVLARRARPARLSRRLPGQKEVAVEGEVGEVVVVVAGEAAAKASLPATRLQRALMPLKRALMPFKRALMLLKKAAQTEIYHTDVGMVWSLSKKSPVMRGKSSYFLEKMRLFSSCTEIDTSHRCRYGNGSTRIFYTYICAIVISIHTSVRYVSPPQPRRRYLIDVLSSTRLWRFGRWWALRGTCGGDGDIYVCIYIYM